MEGPFFWEEKRSTRFPRGGVSSLPPALCRIVLKFGVVPAPYRWFQSRHRARDLLGRPLESKSHYNQLFLSGEMPEATARKPKPYLVTLLTLAVATAARVALTPVLGHQYPFITFFPAVAFVARYAGFRFALVSVVLDALSAGIFFYNPPLISGAISGSDIVGISLFIGLGFFIAWLTEQEHLARQAAV